MESLFNSPLFVAILTVGVTLGVAWAIRRDSNSRADGVDAARLTSIENRVLGLETNSVNKREFEALSKRLDEIRAALDAGLREIREDLREARN